MASLAATFGRGAMTNHWKDIKNADVILVMGANPAENHPCGFKWALEARNLHDARIVTIDPRFTRTSAVADDHLQIRPGSDIALLGGLIRHILTNDLHHADYVRAHTNASFIVSERFSFEDGLFSGFDEATNQYDASAWEYERDADGYARRDLTLEHPRSVFQLLKRHYDRYTPERVAQITGCPEAGFLRIADIICSTGTADRVGTIMYAVGWTMHTVGTQIIRTAAIVQLLLGNIGRPGGGINALRGHANVQGATDHAIVAGILPGYLQVPQPAQTSLSEHLEQSTPRPLVRDTMNYWGNYPKFFVSQLKAWFGDRAQPDNEFGYHYLGKPDERRHLAVDLGRGTTRGKLEGFITLGLQPAAGRPGRPAVVASRCRSLKWNDGHRPVHARQRRVLESAGDEPRQKSTPRCCICRPPTGSSATARSPTAADGPSGKKKAIDPPDRRTVRHLDSVGAVLACERALHSRTAAPTTSRYRIVRRGPT